MTPFTFKAVVGLTDAFKPLASKLSSESKRVQSAILDQKQELGLIQFRLLVIDGDS